MQCVVNFATLTTNLADASNGTHCLVTDRQSLVDVAQYVVEQSQSLETGIKLINAIEAKCKTYAQFPGAGIPRCFVVSSYVVIYRPIDDGIRVILVAHGHQDLFTLIRGISDSE